MGRGIGEGGRSTRHHCKLIANKLSYAMAAIPIGTIVRQAREQAALTQRQLAKRAHTAQSVVARIELGTTSPTVDTVERLLRAAGFELATELRPKVVLDRQLLDDVPRILRLSPDDRLREVANINRFAAHAARNAR